MTGNNGPVKRKATYRASSVPVGRDNTTLESLRLSGLRLLDVENNKQSSSLPTDVIARGRKRASSSCITSQADCAASTSASVAEQPADASGPRPRKRRKRSSSTPLAPRSPQLPARRQSCRRSRSRAGSPTTDVEYIPSSRVSVRVSRRIQSLIDVRSSDIYRHLADPNCAGDLLNEPLARCTVSSTPHETVGPQSVKKPKGRRRKITKLTDENAKKDLMEEWARLRQFQGILPVSGMNGNACFTQTLLDDNRKKVGSVSPEQLGTMTQSNSVDVDAAKNQTTTISILQPQETMHESCSRIQIGSDDVLPIGVDALERELEHKGSGMPSDGVSEHLIVPNLNIEDLSTLMDPHSDKASPSDKPAVLETIPYLDFPLRPGPPLPSLSASPLQMGSVLTRHTESTDLPKTGDANLGNPPTEGHSMTLPQMYPFDNGNLHLDFDEEFHMLDVPEIFTLPWVSASSHLYVPPGLGKLVSGMREQLMIEARARRRAEELYQEELSRRISAEKVVEELRTELEARQKDSSGKPVH